jgi:transcriptional regulator GlxA family with amidase domain
MLRIAQRFQPETGWLPDLFSAQGGPKCLTEAIVVETERLPANLGGYDAVILPGFFAESMNEITARLQSTWREGISRVQRLPEATLVAASCYGTFVLAEAGVLDAAPATTTWWLAGAFQQRYPRVQLDADEALVDGGRAITAGAMTAHSSLTLHVLRRLGGVALARQVGGIMLVDGARSSQRPFVLLQKDYADPLIQRAIRWMEEHLAQAIAISELARAIHVSYRTLNRRFAGVVGMPPLAFLHALRIEHAKELLESTSADFESITERSGYSDASSFRRLFKRRTGLSPGQYRRQFKG